MIRFISLFLTPVFGSDSRPTPPHAQIQAGSCLDVEIDDRALARSQATFFVANTSQSIPGVFYLDISTNYDIGVTELSGVDRVSVGETVFDLSGRLHRPPLFVRHPRELYVGAGPESVFTNQVGSFLYNPFNKTNAQIVIAPSNPTDYAFESEIHYASMTSSSFWKVPISVGIVGEDSTLSNTVECSIAGVLDLIIVPREFLNLVFERFQALGIDAELSRFRASIQLRSPISPAQIDALPSIEFSLNVDNGNRISIAQVTPRDYVVDGPGGTRVMLQAQNCLLTSIVLRKSLIHFDAINHRVGFGKPLNGS